ncbi:MAG: glycosyltransferase family 39 protein [Candidatus Curtissbacteria bacterium]|nr:glycosyltransferase family 39 protein [Candidatus Curtissbacteria bacterium]
MNLIRKITKVQWIFAVILFVIFLFRFPSLYEPFWYGDEGIFAAVARNLNLGGVLYETAWDNKPPMIYLTYQAIFNVFGVSMFWLRLVAAIFVLTTAAAIYEIAHAVLGEKRALVAVLLFGFLSSLRIVEGNLALTEIFMILPISLAMLVAVKRNFDYVSLFAAGVLFAIASLYKQVGALEAAALGIFLFLNEKSFWDFVKKGLALAAGFVVPYALTFLYFAPKHLVGDWIFAAYTYYRIYLGESPKYALGMNIAKFMPIVAAFVYGLWKKKEGRLDVFHLFLLWCAFSFLGSYFSGRTYGHYLVQATVAVALLAASVSFIPKIKRAGIIFGIAFFVPLIFLTKILFTDFLTDAPLSQIKYWRNFTGLVVGAVSVEAYNDFFDSNVNSVNALSDYFASRNARGAKVYIWGDLPWLYAVGDFWNPSRYVTSFHVFGVPNGREEVIGDILDDMPTYILKPPSSIGYFPELEKVITNFYTLTSEIEGTSVYKKIR